MLLGTDQAGLATRGCGLDLLELLASVPGLRSPDRLGVVARDRVEGAQLLGPLGFEAAEFAQVAHALEDVEGEGIGAVGLKVGAQGLVAPVAALPGALVLLLAPAEVVGGTDVEAGGWSDWIYTRHFAPCNALGFLSLGR